MKNSNNTFAALIALAVAAACQSGSSLDVGADTEGDSFEAIRRRLPLTIEPGTEGYDPGERTCGFDGCLPEEFREEVYTHACASGGELVNSLRAAGTGDDCRNRAMAAERHICTAQVMLTVIDSPLPTLVEYEPGGYVSVPPQDAESNSELARLALMDADYALRVAADAFHAETACTDLTDPAGAGDELSSISVAEELAHFYAEALDIARDAGDRMAQAGAAISDAAYSRRADNAEASQDALAPFASRTAAAHMLLGGGGATEDDLGLPAISGVSQEGFFTRGRLSGEAQRAIELIRAAAIDPALISDTSTHSIDNIVVGSGTVPAAASIRYRLGHMQARPSLLEPGVTVGAVYYRLGVTREGFVEAREHLREELRAFDRSPDVMLEPQTLPDGRSTDHVMVGIDLYGATRNPPRQLHSSYWSAVIRYDPTPQGVMTAGEGTTLPAWYAPGAFPQAIPLAPPLPLPPGDTWGSEMGDVAPPIPPTANYHPLVLGRRTVISLVDEGYQRVPDILEGLCPGGTCPPMEDGLLAARNIFVRVLADATPDPLVDEEAAAEARYDTASYIGRARACVYVEDGDVSDFDIHLEIRGLPSAAALFTVRGRDGLACAVDGELEGVPCGSGDFNTDLLVPGSWSDVDAFGSRETTLSGELVTNRPTTNTITLFVVRRRAGVTGAIEPGQFEELTGFILPKPFDPTTVGYRYCTGAAISPLYDRKAAALIQPSPTAPHRPAESCAGLPSDMRIPLENELTSDAGGAASTENSWRHYLDLARTSAEQADALGEDLIRTGLEMDLRAEAAADELSQLCGVSINVTSIAGALGDVPAAIAPPMMGECTPSYYVRRGDQCVLDPVLYALHQGDHNADMDRLRGCLGVDRVPWSTLGDTPLCAWDASPGLPGGLCVGATRDHPCPSIAPSGATSAASCMEAIPMEVTADPIFVDATIGIFQRPPDPQPPLPPTGAELPCAALSLQRGTGSPIVPTGSFAATVALAIFARQDLRSFLQIDRVAPVARNVTWEAGVGDYSTVRYDGSLAFGTGSVLWPMGAPPAGFPMEACLGGVAVTDPSTHDGSVFCLDVSGENRIARSRMNDLLARAVLAVRVFTGNPLHDMGFPYFADTNALLYTEAANTFDWDVFGMDSPTIYYASTGEFNHDAANGDPTGVLPLDVTDFGSSFSYVEGTTGPVAAGCTNLSMSPAIPATAEWSTCPYRGRSPGVNDDCIVFDDGADCDDAGQYPDRNVPFIMRRGDRGLAHSSVAEQVQDMWRTQELTDLVFQASTLSSAERHSRLEPPALSGIGQLTNYFNTWEDEGVDCPLRIRYEQCVADQPHLRLQEEGNIAFIGRHTGLTTNDFLNGLEVACWAAHQAGPSFDETSCDEPTEIQTFSDAYRMRGYLQCRADELSSQGSSSLIQDLPQKVVEALRRDGTGAYGGGAGEFDAQVSDLRAALLELGSHRLDMAADMRAFSSKITSLDAVVSQSERAQEIERLSFIGNSLDRIAQCVTAATEAATVDPAAAAGKAASAATVCANGAAQTLISLAITRLREQNVEDAIIDEFARFTVEATEFSRRASQRSLAIRAALERIDGSISRLRITQTNARRALARALMLDDDGMGRHFAVNTVYHARYNTLLERYRESHQRSVRSAFIARLALEQRLGMPLADIEDDVFSDEAPREWVDTICTLPSIDYDRIRDNPGPGGSPEADPAPSDYSGAYVGDYVRRLEQVFESYSFVHPFRDGTDTAVISLRDDVMRTRAPCSVPSPNLLYNGGRLDVFASASRPGWRITGCDVAAGTVGNRQCVNVRPAEFPADGIPLPFEASRIARAAPYVVDFGEAPVVDGSTRLEQTVRLGPGRYRLSAYVTNDDWAVLAEDEDGPLFAPTFVAFQEPAEGDWKRVWTFFDVPTERDVTVFIPRDNDATETTDIDYVLIAGVMLEDVTGSVIGDVTRTEDIEEGNGTISMDVVYGQRAAPSPYFESGDDGHSEIRACLDHNGDYFRREAWEYGCVRVCQDGYDGNCPEEWAETRCYWQTSFGISSDDLSNLLLAGDAGFAAGNHNYRIESVGVNLVGTGLRDCTGTGSSGCFGSGNASYSIEHLGPYLVRNARGSLYDAPLFPGRLESARALASERYLTNPLSSTDRGLIEPYTRYELQGRPLGGSLILRIWDDPTFRFDRLEDVQIALTYRYWQHQR